MLQMAGRMEVLGTETAFEVLARANALAAQGRSIINLGIGQPDFPTPDHIVEAGRRRLPTGITAIPRPMASRGGARRRRRPLPSPQGRGVARPRAGGARRQVTMFFAIMMFGEPGRRDPVSQPRLSDLR